MEIIRQVFPEHNTTMSKQYYYSYLLVVSKYLRCNWRYNKHFSLSHGGGGNYSLTPQILGHFRGISRGRTKTKKEQRKKQKKRKSF